MKKLIPSIVIFFLLTMNQSRAELIDRIKAVVNGEVITQGEIDRLLYPVYDRYRHIYEGQELQKKLEEANDEILNQLIEDKLILSEARNEGVTVEQKEIEQRIEELRAKLSGHGNLNDILKEQNISVKDLRERYSEQIMIEKIVDLKVRQAIQIMPQEAENFYRAHIDNFSEPEQVRVSTILIRRQSTRTPEEGLTLAEDLLGRLKDGEDFRALAKNYSEGMNAEEGGDMGYVKKGQMVKEIDDIIFNLEIGRFSELLKTSLGYNIFKVYDKKKERIVPLAEALPSIMDMMYREKFKEKFLEWVEELKDNAFISIR